jgi:hypothetical protein
MGRAAQFICFGKTSSCNSIDISSFLIDGTLHSKSEAKMALADYSVKEPD